LILMDRHSLTMTGRALKWDWGAQYSVAPENLFSLSTDDRNARRIAIASPDDSQEFHPPAERGYGICQMFGTRNCIVLRYWHSITNDQHVRTIGLSSGKSQVTSLPAYWSIGAAFTYAGTDYAVLCEK